MKCLGSFLGGGRVIGDMRGVVGVASVARFTNDGANTSKCFYPRGLLAFGLPCVRQGHACGVLVQSVTCKPARPLLRFDGGNNLAPLLDGLVELW